MTKKDFLEKAKELGIDLSLSGIFNVFNEKKKIAGNIDKKFLSHFFNLGVDLIRREGDISFLLDVLASNEFCTSLGIYFKEKSLSWHILDRIKTLLSDKKDWREIIKIYLDNADNIDKKWNLSDCGGEGCTRLSYYLPIFIMKIIRDNLKSKNDPKELIDLDKFLNSYSGYEIQKAFGKIAPELTKYFLENLGNEYFGGIELAFDLLRLNFSYRILNDGKRVYRWEMNYPMSSEIETPIIEFIVSNKEKIIMEEERIENLILAGRYIDDEGIKAKIEGILKGENFDLSPLLNQVWQNDLFPMSMPLIETMIEAPDNECRQLNEGAKKIFIRYLYELIGTSIGERFKEKIISKIRTMFVGLNFFEAKKLIPKKEIRYLIEDLMAEKLNLLLREKSDIIVIANLYEGKSGIGGNKKPFEERILQVAKEYEDIRVLIQHIEYVIGLHYLGSNSSFTNSLLNIIEEGLGKIDLKTITSLSSKDRGINELVEKRKIEIAKSLIKKKEEVPKDFIDEELLKFLYL